MNLRYITCSDPREDTPIEDILHLSQTAPNVEIAVQAHPSKMSFDMPRRKWFECLLKESLSMPTAPNLAVHLNLDWCDKFCQGILAPDLLDLFFLLREDGTPAIHRWQINIHGSKTKLFKPDNIARILNNYSGREFIFQYGASEYHRMQRLDNRMKRFDVETNFSILYDTSGGAGKLTKNWRAPLFEDHSQGYAGGLSPENVSENLDKIAKVAGDRTDIWIDAEGKLKTPGTKTFDIKRAEQYINAALKWQKTK